MTISTSTSLRSLSRNSLRLFVARVGAQALGFLYLAIVARRLAPADFGHLTWIAALTLIGNTFTTFGTDIFLIREVARQRSMLRPIQQAFTLQLGLSLIWCVVSLVWTKNPALLIYSLGLFPLAAFSVASACLRALERMDLFWMLSLGSAGIQLVGALLVPNLLGLCLVFSLGNVVAARLGWWLAVQAFPEFRLLPLLNVRSLLPLVWPFALLMTFSVIYQRIGLLLAAWTLGDAATAHFALPLRVVDALKLGHYAFLGALLPKLSKRSLGVEQQFRQSLVGLLALVCGLAILFSDGAASFLSVLFGNSYRSDGPLLQVLVWSLLPYTVSAFLSVRLVAEDREGKLLQVTIFALTSATLFYGLGLHFYGLRGAAVATVLSEIVQAALLGLALWRTQRKLIHTCVIH